MRSSPPARPPLAACGVLHKAPRLSAAASVLHPSAPFGTPPELWPLRAFPSFPTLGAMDWDASMTAVGTLRYPGSTGIRAGAAKRVGSGNGRGRDPKPYYCCTWRAFRRLPRHPITRRIAPFIPRDSAPRAGGAAGGGAAAAHGGVHRCGGAAHARRGAGAPTGSHSTRGTGPGDRR